MAIPQRSLSDFPSLSGGRRIPVRSEPWRYKKATRTTDANCKVRNKQGHCKEKKTSFRIDLFAYIYVISKHNQQSKYLKSSSTNGRLRNQSDGINSENTNATLAPSMLPSLRVSPTVVAYISVSSNSVYCINAFLLAFFYSVSDITLCISTRPR